jgi:hypothetical protein
LIEIEADGGFVYAQCTHNLEEPPNYGSLLRVMPKVHAARPDDLAWLAAQPHQFLCLFPLRAAVRGSKAKALHVGNFPVPIAAAALPVFRVGLLRKGGGYAEDSWWLWDGRKEWFVGRLSPEQRRLPIRGVWNSALIVERVQSGWSDDGG